MCNNNNIIMQPRCSTTTCTEPVIDNTVFLLVCILPFFHSLSPFSRSLQYRSPAPVSRRPPPSTGLTWAEETPFPLPSPRPTSQRQHWTRPRQPQPFLRWPGTQVMSTSTGMGAGLATPPSRRRVAYLASENIR